MQILSKEIREDTEKYGNVHVFFFFFGLLHNLEDL